MDAAKKAMWVEALRSGEYAQTKNVLTRVNAMGEVEGHCCLGVLCEVAIKDGVELKVNDNDDGIRWYNSSTGTLPAEVMEWAGILSDDMDANSNPLFGPYGDRKPASEWNDDVNLPFTAIADLIETDTYL